MDSIAGAILVVGLAAVSVYAHLKSGGDVGAGWGLLAFLLLILWDWGVK